MTFAPWKAQTIKSSQIWFLIISLASMTIGCNSEADQSNLVTIENFSGLRSERPVCGHPQKHYKSTLYVADSNERSDRQQAHQKLVNVSLGWIDDTFLDQLRDLVGISIQSKISTCEHRNIAMDNCVTKLSGPKIGATLLVHTRPTKEGLNNLPYMLGMIYAQYYGSHAVEGWDFLITSLRKSFLKELEAHDFNAFKNFSNHFVNNVDETADADTPQLNDKILGMHLFAASFDSYYCNIETRESFRQIFPRTNDVFSKIVASQSSFSLIENVDSRNRKSGAKQVANKVAKDGLKEFVPKAVGNLTKGVRNGVVETAAGVRNQAQNLLVGGRMLAQDVHVRSATASAAAAKAAPVLAPFAAPVAAGTAALAFSVGVPLYVGKQIYDQRQEALEFNRNNPPLVAEVELPPESVGTRQKESNETPEISVGNGQWYYDENGRKTEVTLDQQIRYEQRVYEDSLKQENAQRNIQMHLNLLEAPSNEPEVNAPETEFSDYTYPSSSLPELPDDLSAPIE